MASSLTLAVSRATRRCRLQRQVEFRDSEWVIWIVFKESRHVRKPLWEWWAAVAAIAEEAKAVGIKDLHLGPLFPIVARRSPEGPAHLVEFAAAVWATRRHALARATLKAFSTAEACMRD